MRDLFWRLVIGKVIMDLDFFESGAALNAKSEAWWRFNNSGKTPLRCVVAIPVKDEAKRLPACLAALAGQTDKKGRTLDREAFGIVVFANNCSDGSAAIARAIGKQHSLKLRVVEALLPAGQAHAGRARRGAMDAAEQWLASEAAINGVILTTDADSRVSPDWLANNLVAIAAGADAVLGTIRLDEEGDRLPVALHRRGAFESAYENLLAQTSALIDPIAHDPWPHHSTISGASLGITREAYFRVGGLPVVPLGEDKALVAALHRVDARIRHCDEVLVTTSGRCQGRAPGGVADTLRLRSVDPSAPCDEALEPYRVAFARAKWKRRLRLLWRVREFLYLDSWPQALRIPQACVERVCSSSTFGAAWELIEAHSPRLMRRPLAPAELPQQILLARQMVGRLSRLASQTNQNIEAEAVMSIAALESALRADARDEEIGGVIAG
jgi:cellulose synthase/poly-beta-1,6-N-acetylglucosamine synthase-like glycosyltransferase